jgi:hypothetical protein
LHDQIVLATSFIHRFHPLATVALTIDASAVISHWQVSPSPARVSISSVTSSTPLAEVTSSRVPDHVLTILRHRNIAVGEPLISTGKIILERPLSPRRLTGRRGVALEELKLGIQA